MKAHPALLTRLVFAFTLLLALLAPARLQAQNVTLARIITTVAGNGTLGFFGDGGPATSAEVHNPFGVAVDSAGNLYIADVGNHRIRKVTPGGVITTVAGNPNGTSGYGGDGGPATAIAAELNGPFGVAVDSAGNLYIADTANQRIRKVDTSGNITTVAGNGTFGFSGDSGAATGAQLANPTGVAVDTVGNLYIAEQTSSHIRKVSTNGTISTVAGGGAGCVGQTDAVGDGCAATSAQLNGPYEVAVDSAGNLYIADTGNQRIRKVNTSGVISTVAGSAAGGYAGDGGPATSAELNQPTGVFVDNAGNFYIGDSANERVRKVDAGGTITTVAGNGTNGYAGDNGPSTSAELYNPNGVAVDGSGNLYIAEYVNERIRKVAASGPVNFAQTNLGANTTQNVFLSIDSALTLSSVQASGDFSVVGNSCVLNTAISAGTICALQVTFAPSQPGQRWFPLMVTASDPVQYSFGLEGTGMGSALAFTPGIITTAAVVPTAIGPAVDSVGNLYVAEADGNQIRKVDTNGIITTVAGSGTAGYGGDSGPAITAEINTPVRLAVDSLGNLYIADTNNSRIRKVDTGGIITTVAGGGNGCLSQGGDGCPATSAELLNPYGLAVDNLGNLYFGDSTRIHKINANGTITRVAGGGAGCAGQTDSVGDGCIAMAAKLNFPYGIAVDSGGNLYIADYGNERIRKVDTSGTITTVAGNGTSGYSGDGGPATSAQLNAPTGVAVDSAGDLYITEFGNGRVRKVDTSGIITTVAGNGTAFYSGDGGPAPSAGLGGPHGLALDNAGNLYIADFVDDHVRKVNVSASAFSFGSLNVGQTSSAQSVAVSDVGNAPLNFTSILASSNFQLQSVGNDCAVGTPLAIGATCELGAAFAPTTAGNPLTGTLTVADDAFNSPQSVSLGGIANSVGQPPAITSANNRTFEVGTAGSFTVTATGTPATTFSESGAVPNGVNFNTSTGVLSGTPAAGTGGTYPIVITASNGIAPNATQNFTLTVDQSPAITSAASTAFTVGTSGSFTVTGTGFPASTFSKSGVLPNGVTFNASTGVLGGPPSAGTGGTYQIVITAANGIAPNATQNFTLTVNQSPAITSVASTALTVGAAGSFTVAGTGFPAPTFSESGALPNGVNFSVSTGVLSGMPATGTGGTYPIVITAANGISPNATQNFTLSVQDFSFAAVSPISLSVGGSSSPSVTVNSLGGFNSPVALSLSAPPSGVSASLSSASVTPTGNATLNLSLGPSVVPSTFNLTVTGDSGSLTRTATATVTVTANTSTLTNVIQQLLNAGCIDNSGIGNALTSKLSAAQSYINMGDSLDAINALTALKNQLNAQNGKHIAASCTIGGVTFSPANVLLTDVQSLINSLRVGSLADPIIGYVVTSSGVGISGVTVSLLASGGGIVAAATTDVTGFYYFATTGGVLTNGTNYTIQVTLPAGFNSSTPPASTFNWGGSGFTLNFSLN